MSDLGPVTDPANDPILEVVGICHRCQRRTGLTKCTAFDGDIPAEIMMGVVVHTEPYPGDNGRQFVPLFS